jgi:predicted dehydrogenase
MKQMKAAVAGLGFMGPTHIEALRRAAVDVVGLVGIDRAEGERVAERLHVPKVYDNFEQLIKDKDVEVVHLCTPNNLHHPMAKLALKAGKHVISEKPLALDSKQAAELVKLAAERNLVGAVNYNLRFYPLNHEARARVQDGDIGKVFLIHGGYCQDWLLLPTDWNWRLDPLEGGTLRAVADIGTHWLDAMCWVTGLKVTAVMADMSTIVKTRFKPHKAVETYSGKLAVATDGDPVEIKTEDYAGILLEFDNGARGTLTLSQVSSGRKNCFWWEINGSDSSMSWDQETPNQLWIGHRDRPNEILLKDPSLMKPDARKVAAYPGGHAEGYPDTFSQMVRTVYGYIAEGDFSKPRPFATFEDGWRELALCEAIEKSAKKRAWVEVK